MSNGLASKRMMKALWQSLKATARHSRLTNRVGAWRFTGPGAEDLFSAPPDLRPANPALAQEFYAGRLVMAGISVDTRGQSPFLQEDAPQPWEDSLHSFRWLRHLHAAQSELARQFSWSLVDEWNRLHGSQYRHRAWSLSIAATRLMAFLTHANVLVHSGEPEKLMRIIMRHVRFLRLGLQKSSLDQAHLKTSIALVYASQILDGPLRNAPASKRDLDHLLQRQIMADGGHISRSPAVSMDILIDCLMLASAMEKRATAVPRELKSSIDRMMGFIKSLLHADGQLAQFNGGEECQVDLMESVLSNKSYTGLSLTNLVNSGYQRLAAGKSVILVDTGTLPPVEASRSTHAGCLSIEFSHKGNRIITNCGVPRIQSGDLAKLGRSTAAHSSLTLKDTSSAKIGKSPLLRMLSRKALVSGQGHVPVERGSTEDGRIWMNASHNGYEAEFGIIHQRAISISKNGEEIEAEDRLFVSNKTMSMPDLPFSLRFHVMPGITLAPLNKIGAVLITGPRKIAWELSFSDGDVTIEPSIYLADFNAPQPCQQICVNGSTRDQNSISWTLRKVASNTPSSKTAKGDAIRPVDQGEFEL